MDSKTTGIVTYLTIVGFIIALAAGTKDEKSVQHMNNSLNYMLFFGAPLLVCLVFLIIPVVGMIIYFAGLAWAMFGGVLMLIGFINACQDKTFVFPVVGGIHIIKAE